ncbi:hypothetical protein ES319_D07G187000v1 [Gossypium barbadense]|uniref:ABC1 atypical kinase-like domain-containing protein n=2 Tax=Gossypium TaxID=3633 RepID=A0A5J5QT29_GOSBA|nr:hypothetical protein ES319_D07G187000v1 [Gossypium barbadense]KAB2022120.1 hypothetical protein ES319_D07G187000v1 [Gossypium barbadense]TYG62111.1 hypothetical protein ES288_D07G201700v1 [Gossypium darwinii]
MTVILASHSCYSCNYEMMNQGRAVGTLSFSGSISNNFVNLERQIYCLPMTGKSFRFQVEMQQTEPTPKVGINGRAVKMVPASEVVKRQAPAARKVEQVNGVKQVINGNGASIVRRKNSPSLVKMPISRVSKDLPPLEELKILPSDENFSWANENYSSLQRSIDVWSFVISLRVRVLLDNAKWAYAGGFTEDKQKKRRRTTASWLRERVLQLGPTFIKLGQLSSTRSDLFPREFVDELAKLQDKVPAFSPKKARGFIEKELGAPIHVLFKEFEDQPIAAASLGQVHRAVLHNGEKVVVKVQRPGLKKLFDIDLRNLKLIAEYFQNSETLGGPSRDWVGIYEECSTILYQEIDYINEGKNADRFCRDFRNIKWVRVPMVFWDYTATKVLTLEYVPGIKINQLDALDARGYNRSRISSHAIEAYLIQILRTGFFHADPHPGNLAIDVDESIIYYDFGMMGEIKSFTRERLLELFYAVYEKDAKKVMKSLIDLGALQPTGDLSSVRRSVQFFLDNLLDQRPDQDTTLAAIGEDLFAIAQDQPFRFPSTFTFVLRAFSTLEGIGYILDPNFSFAKIAAPYAQELLDIRQRQRTGSQLVQEIRKQADDARSYTMSMPYRVQRIEEILKQLESGDLRLRVRVLESERAARKATILQMATMYTVLGGTLVNLGVTFSSQGSQIIANGSFVGAGVFLTLFLRSMQRVKKLDKFEKMI